uniref:Murine leukemia virus integrase C-terminal domain-containing protein n=1 Tax=Larimichthys crocea TaxID=215358 RepID=A0A0F8CCY1_LARCR
MDGEFDRETDGGGWGPSSSYKTVTEQLLEMQGVVRSMYDSKDTTEIIKQMREDVKIGVSILQQVTSQQEGGQHTPPPEVEWVLLRVIKRKWSEPRWTGPFQVTERTSHAVRLRGKGDTWFHWSQCAAAEEPQRSLSEIQTNLQEKSTESADSETDPTSTNGAE